MGAGRPGVLLPGGSFVVKLLQGAGSDDFHLRLRPHFRRLAWVQPKATRPESREMYVVGVQRIICPADRAFGSDSTAFVGSQYGCTPQCPCLEPCSR
jgi:hypothetical protein